MDYLVEYAPLPSFKSKNSFKRRVAITAGIIAALYASERHSMFVSRTLRSVKRQAAAAATRPSAAFPSPLLAHLDALSSQPANQPASRQPAASQPPASRPRPHPPPPGRGLAAAVAAWIEERGGVPLFTLQGACAAATAQRAAGRPAREPSRARGGRPAARTAVRGRAPGAPAPAPGPCHPAAVHCRGRGGGQRGSPGRRVLEGRGQRPAAARGVQPPQHRLGQQRPLAAGQQARGGQVRRSPQPPGVSRLAPAPVRPGPGRPGRRAVCCVQLLVPLRPSPSAGRSRSPPPAARRR
jgi:hypothetical protein